MPSSVSSALIRVMVQLCRSTSRGQPRGRVVGELLFKAEPFAQPWPMPISDPS